MRTRRKRQEKFEDDTLKKNGPSQGGHDVTLTFGHENTLYLFLVMTGGHEDKSGQLSVTPFYDELQARVCVCFISTRKYRKILDFISSSVVNSSR
jgi:hypothetical protein